MVNTSQVVFVAAVQLATLAIPALSAPVLAAGLQTRDDLVSRDFLESSFLEARGKEISRIAKHVVEGAKDPANALDAGGVVKDAIERQGDKPAGHQQSIANQLHQQKGNAAKHGQHKRAVYDDEAVFARDVRDLYEDLLSRGLEDSEDLD